MKYAHENGCPWDVYTCTYAAENGYLRCLRYAHNNDCPWDGLTCRIAAKNGNLDCLKYIHRNNCMYDKYILLMNREYFKKHIIEYIEKCM